jgi:hypothetical protein
MLARVDFLNLTVTDYNNIFTRITVVYSTFLWHKVMLKNAKKVEEGIAYFNRLSHGPFHWSYKGPARP